MSAIIAIAALLVSLCSLLFSFFSWKRSSRPIVTAAVQTHKSGNQAITYNLVILNSGTIPAKNVRIKAAPDSLEQALGTDATPENKERWLACFGRTVLLLQRGESIRCAFGTTRLNNAGFWKHKAVIPITITYEDWFGWKYTDKQKIQITGSDSFTDYYWATDE
jgi:uncharacterized repeat protein (TIGR01451 family)